MRRRKGTSADRTTVGSTAHLDRPHGRIRHGDLSSLRRHHKLGRIERQLLLAPVRPPKTLFCQRARPCAPRPADPARTPAFWSLLPVPCKDRFARSMCIGADLGWMKVMSSKIARAVPRCAGRGASIAGARPCASSSTANKSPGIGSEAPRRASASAGPDLKRASACSRRGNSIDMAKEPRLRKPVARALEFTGARRTTRAPAGTARVRRTGQARRGRPAKANDGRRAAQCPG